MSWKKGAGRGFGLVGGTGLGAKAGMIVGTAVWPGVGTAIGGIIGGALCGWLGYRSGEKNPEGAALSCVAIIPACQLPDDAIRKLGEEVVEGARRMMT